MVHSSSWVSAQYVINGDAQQLSCNCYRLTEAINNQGGSVWNSNMISLNDPFDFTFDVYLGTQNASGADGVAFVLQPVSTAEGNWGGGMGYESISPSVAVEVDTWQNDWDPAFDHIAIQKNGDVNHTTANNLAAPEYALVSGGNIEDGLYHVMRVTWDPTTTTLQAYMDGSLRITYVGDMVTNIFGNDPMVFWGFTGSTGGANNVHEFCLAIIPGLTSDQSQICAGEEVQFFDDSYSALGDVVSWSWDFGNGQTSTNQNPGAVSFSQAGTYDVIQTIVDAAGCDATDTLEITVHPNPQADFVATEVCEGNESAFTSQSSVPSGSISSYGWNLGDGQTGIGSSVSHTYADAGTFDVQLLVTSNFGCTDSITQEVVVYQNPTADFTGESNSLDGSFTTVLQTGESAEWFLVDTSFTGLNSFNFTFPDSGWYDVTLVVTNENGCTDTILYSFYIEGVPEYEVPNVFTPNGDDFNEYFEPFTYAITDAEMKIFNRWGRPVYKYEGPVVTGTNWGWDGSINGGAEAATGTYYYILDMKGTDGNVFNQQGTVTLVR